MGSNARWKVGGGGWFKWKFSNHNKKVLKKALFFAKRRGACPVLISFLHQTHFPSILLLSINTWDSTSASRGGKNMCSSSSRRKRWSVDDRGGSRQKYDILKTHYDRYATPISWKRPRNWFQCFRCVIIKVADRKWGWREAVSPPNILGRQWSFISKEMDQCDVNLS